VNQVSDTDTIAAIATPIGIGGIAVIRISGPAALEIADKSFRGKVSLNSAASHTAHFGTFVDGNEEAIDQVVATVFREPHSYTGEDVVEVSCHGGIYVTRSVLEAVLKSGARAATAGEFTKRAFLSGRIDLAQAEATADLIQASSSYSQRISLSQLEGRLSFKINELREKLINSCSLLELELDFSEEGLEFIDKSNIINEINSIVEPLKALHSSYSTGKIYREGVKVVIAGKPNVGKSSLMNALLQSNRAIVTEVPGTTRDVLEENIILDGLLFRLVDTAGVRTTSDIVESEGVRRTQREIEDADIALFIVDPTQGFDQQDGEIVALMKSHFAEETHSVVNVLNKTDICSEMPPNIQEWIHANEIIRISATKGTGLMDLRGKLVSTALEGKQNISDRSLVLTNARHRQAIEETLTSLDTVKAGLSGGISNDLVAVDLHRALNSLGEIIGVVSSEDVINNIFSKFCIGK
jgi:tRNA modification GTPase